MSVLEIETKSRKILRVGGRDYALAFPLTIVADLETKLGRSMKAAPDWLHIETREVKTILEAGLAYYHADEANAVAERICETLDPEEIDTVIEALCVAACPKAMERIQKAVEEARERIQKGLPLPNVQGADAS